MYDTRGVWAPIVMSGRFCDCGKSPFWHGVTAHHDTSDKSMTTISLNIYIRPDLMCMRFVLLFLVCGRNSQCQFSGSSSIERKGNSLLRYLHTCMYTWIILRGFRLKCNTVVWTGKYKIMGIRKSELVFCKCAVLVPQTDFKVWISIRRSTRPFFHPRRHLGPDTGFTSHDRDQTKHSVLWASWLSLSSLFAISTLL